MKYIGPEEAEEGKPEKVLVELERFLGELDERQLCYIHAMGGQYKATFDQFRNVTGVSVINVFSCLPAWMGLLGRVIPSNAGVIKISDPAALVRVFRKLDDSTLVGVYAFSSDRMLEFDDFATKRPTVTNVDEWARTVDKGIFYFIDPNNVNARTGVYHWIMLGSDIRSELVSKFEALIKA